MSVDKALIYNRCILIGRIVYLCDTFVCNKCIEDLFLFVTFVLYICISHLCVSSVL